MFLGSVGIKLFQNRERDMVTGMMNLGADQAGKGDNTITAISSNNKRSNNNDEEKEERKENEQLVDSLWSKLPEDLLLGILARLPLESLARLELVCKNWRSLFTNNPSFLHLRSDTTASTHNSWFIFQRKQQHQSLPSSSALTVDCYNTHTNKWHELKFDHLPQIQQVCAVAGSLLLCVGKIRVCRLPPPTAIAARHQDPGRIEPPSYKFLDMVVCNPLKPNSWDRIPERIGSFVPHMGIVADPHTGNYKVVLASLEKTEIYDSRQKNWKLFDNILSPLHDVCSSPVEYRGRLLFLGVGAHGQGKVFVYKLENNTCSSFDTPFSRDPFPRFGYLENCGGRLLMVRVTVSSTELLRSRELQQGRNVRFERNFQLRVCEYLHRTEDLSDGVWRKLTSIPMLELESCMSVNSKEGAQFLSNASRKSSSLSSSSSASASQNDLLCFTMGMKDGKLDCTNCVEGRAVFLYSLSQNLWCFVGERSDWGLEGVICVRSLQFQPSLQASFGP
ncbi:unnamed protein product [Calypogeia fissa]